MLITFKTSAYADIIMFGDRNFWRHSRCNTCVYRGIHAEWFAKLN